MSNLYHWSVAECLENYSSGDIIVMASSLEEAKQKARENIITYLKQERSWWFNEDGTLDEDFGKDDYRSFMETLEEDLKKEPDTVESGTVFIRGSE